MSCILSYDYQLFSPDTPLLLGQLSKPSHWSPCFEYHFHQF